MKKITLLFASLFVSGVSFAQADSDSGTADVNAEIVSPISIENGTALNFGSINGTATGGDVTINTNGNRTFSNDEMDITTATTVTAALFKITASNGFGYDVTIPDTELTGPGTNMDVTFSHDRVAVSDRIGSGSAQDLNVGGTLTVNDAQTAGDYSGTVTVTVNYN
ncbi:DUF4402 domain-containing protein [Christiangramia forsetii]|uniref:Secreted protein n=2 Tax=Christiangramia forsetii TaxID=411153 RepID=A0M1N7_CHRFK|nr:DUF4402 domain-containing protein [Christiangramia forsetii]GGG42060.1 hypothetical protein GCM10011532_27340 [Christiangramia forsetii]CAL66532.1 secreted protein [Christiangramia forsetii KT0803]